MSTSPVRSLWSDAQLTVALTLCSEYYDDCRCD